MKKTFITFVILSYTTILFASNTSKVTQIIAGDKTFDVTDKNTAFMSRAHDRYQRIRKASQIITPDEIIKVAFTFTFIDNIFSINKLEGVLYDEASFSRMASYIKDSVHISDHGKFKIGGDKYAIKSIIGNKLNGKKAALVFFAGHGLPDGRIPLPTHMTNCKQLYAKLKAEQYIRPTSMISFFPIWKLL